MGGFGAALTNLKVKNNIIRANHPLVMCYVINNAITDTGVEIDYNMLSTPIPARTSPGGWAGTDTTYTQADLASFQSITTFGDHQTSGESIPSS